MNRSGLKGAGRAVAVVALAGTLAACGSSKSGEAKSSASGLPAEIPVTYVSDHTGLAGAVGQADYKGMQTAMEAAKRSGIIGTSKIKITVLDTGGDVQKATTSTSRAISSDAVAMFGPAISSEGLPAAQVAQRGKIPFLAVQSNAPGLSKLGEYTYAGTPGPAAYVPLTAQYVQEKWGTKSAGFIYGSDAPALTLGWETFKSDLQGRGIKTTTSVGLPNSATDFTAAATKVAGPNPDAVGVVLTANQNATAVSALRRAGYKGRVFAYNGAAGGYLKAAGAGAKDVPYAVSYGADMPVPSTKEFEKLFAELHPGETPSVFNAEGYAAMDLLIHALAASKDASRSGVVDGLKKVAASDGFDSSLGRITLGGPDKRDALSPGALLLWNGSKEQFVSTGGK